MSRKRRYRPTPGEILLFDQFQAPPRGLSPAQVVQIAETVGWDYDKGCPRRCLSCRYRYGMMIGCTGKAVPYCSKRTGKQLSIYQWERIAETGICPDYQERIGR